MALRRPTLLFCIMTIVLGVNYEITRPSFNQGLHDLKPETLLSRYLLSAIPEVPTCTNKRHKAGNSDSLAGEESQGMPTLPAAAAEDIGKEWQGMPTLPAAAAEDVGKERQGMPTLPAAAEDVGKDESIEGKSCCLSVLNESLISVRRREIKAVRRYPGVLPGYWPVVLPEEREGQSNATTTATPTPHSQRRLPKHPEAEPTAHPLSQPTFTPLRTGIPLKSNATCITKNVSYPPRLKSLHDVVSLPLLFLAANSPEDSESRAEDAFNNSLCQWKGSDDDLSTHMLFTDFNDSQTALLAAWYDEKSQENDVHSNEDARDSHDTSNERILKCYEMYHKSDETPEQKRELSLVCLCITLMFFRNEELRQRVITPLFDTLKDTSVQKLIAELLQWIAKHSGSKGLSLLHDPEKPAANGLTDDKVHPLLNKGHKLGHIPQVLSKRSEGNHKLFSEEAKSGKSDPFRLVDFTHFIPRPHYITLPLRFLPSTESPSQDKMSYIGYRLASLNSLPECNISKTLLADTGFYYDNSKTQRNANNILEVTCYSCRFSYSQWKKGDSPDLIHKQHSPNCQHLKENSTTTISGTNSSSLSSMFTNGSSSMALSNASSGYCSMNGGSLGSSQSMSFDYTSSDNAPQLSAHTQPTSAPDSRPAPDSAATNHQRNQQPPALHADSMATSQTNTDLATDCAAIPPSVVTSATPFTNEGTRTWVAAARDTASLPPSNHSSLFGYGDWNRARTQGIDDRPPVSMTDAVYPQFSRMQDRRATYANWPLGRLFQPDDLVMQGFYYAGYADCIRCFYCGVGLKSWSEGDDIMTEHIRWRPSCGYLLNTKGRQFVHDIAQRIQGSQEQTDQANQGNQGFTSTTQSNSARQTAPAASTGTSQTSGTAAPSSASRAASTSAANTTAAGSSPSSSAGTPSRNAATGASSEVVRAVQEMGFSSDNIARAVHQLQQSGVTRIEVDAVLEILLSMTTDGDDTSDAAATEQNRDLQTDGAEDNASAADYAERLASENARLKERNKCKICKSAKVGMIFLPCGHIVACTECGSKMRTCSMCGNYIRATANVFI